MPNTEHRSRLRFQAKILTRYRRPRPAQCRRSSNLQGAWNQKPSYPINNACMSGHRAVSRARLNVPNVYCVIEAAGSKPTAVRRPSDPTNTAGKTDEAANEAKVGKQPIHFHFVVAPNHLWRCEAGQNR